VAFSTCIGSPSLLLTFLALFFAVSLLVLAPALALLLIDAEES